LVEGLRVWWLSGLGVEWLNGWWLRSFDGFRVLGFGS